MTEDETNDRGYDGRYDALCWNCFRMGGAGQYPSGHNGVLVVDTEYTVSDATINLITDADGTDTCDFSGKGAAVAAFGEGARVTIENSTVHGCRALSARNA